MGHNFCASTFSLKNRYRFQGIKEVLFAQPVRNFCCRRLAVIHKPPTLEQPTDINRDIGNRENAEQGHWVQKLDYC